MISTKNTRIALALLTSGLMAAAGLADTTFTYQGELRQSGEPFSGNVTMTFALYDAADAGNLLGEQINDVYVENGKFTAALDFGAQKFADDELWLQVIVGGEALLPRQAITATPYALQTRGLTTTADRRVGVGIENPLLKLHVGGRAIFEQGADSSAGMWFKNDDSPNAYGNAFIGLADGMHVGLYGSGGGGWGLVMNRMNARVGIGAIQPLADLHVIGDTIQNTTMIESPSQYGTWLSLLNTSAGSNVWSLVSTGSASAQGTDNLVIRRHSAGLDALTFKPNGDIITAGRIGIGVDNPTEALEVNGRIRTSVLQITGGSDIAEPFNVHGCTPAEPGMVVSIDPARVGELRVSAGAYDTTVAGVISGANGVNPGLTLTQTGTVADGEHPVALTGRVWVWCDADAGGAIAAGDLLTTADTPGHAMRVQDRERASGAILGKAMSSLESGKGLVLVLVNLQ